MSEATLRHGLEAFLADAPQSAATDCAAAITIRGDLGHINLRGRSTDDAFVKAVESVLEQPLPLQANTMSQDAHRIFWLGPDEWLVVTVASGASELAQKLQDKTSTMHASVNELGGGQIALQLEGPGARDLLAKGCTLDLHPNAFKPGDCAQSGLAKASVALALVDEAPVFMIIVRRSFADYLCRWLTHAGREDGITFGAVSG